MLDGIDPGTPGQHSWGALGLPAVGLWCHSKAGRAEGTLIRLAPPPHISIGDAISSSSIHKYHFPTTSVPYKMLSGLSTFEALPADTS
jgi:hypothetical protein